MMTPDALAEEIAKAFSSCRKFKRLTQQDVATRAGCEVDVVERIERAEFADCFALREKYADTGSIERRLCDAIGLTPRLCPALDGGIIF